MNEALRCPVTNNSCRFFNYCSIHRDYLDEEAIVRENELVLLRAKIPQEKLEACIRTYCSEERLLILADLAIEYAADIRTFVAINRVAERIEARRLLF